MGLPCGILFNPVNVLVIRRWIVTSLKIKPMIFRNHEHRHSLKRIVLANGTSGYSFFKKHFAQWLKSGEWQVVSVLADNKNNGNTRVTNPPAAGTKTSTIDIIPAWAVSPAAAKYSYVEKRDFWEKHVYQPGLQDFLANQSISLPDTPDNAQVAKPVDDDE